jgi:uncharacterized membrane protein
VSHNIGILVTVMSLSSNGAMQIVPILVLASGILTALISLPLIRGKVPPNVIYGIRTKRAFSSRENWYRINKYGGKMFLRAGLLIIAVGVTGFFLPAADLAIYGIIAAIVVLGSVLGAVVMCLLAG